MPNGGARPGSGRRKKVQEGPELPPRKRGRPSKADLAARDAATAAWNAEQAALKAAAPPAAPAPPEAVPAGPPGAVKPVAYTPEMPADVSPKDYFLILMRDPRVSAERRDRAAQVAIGYTEAKPGEAKLGKKEQRQQTADGLTKGGSSKFGGVGRPPLSVVGNGG